VQVEFRSGAGEGYGKGRKREMRFGELVDRLAAGDSDLYLTTQEVGAPGVLASERWRARERARVFAVAAGGPGAACS
jgi:hypothetical protein